MDRAALEAAMLAAHFAQKAKGPSMTAAPEKHVAAMAEPAWDEIERLRGLLRDAGEIVREQEEVFFRSYSQFDGTFADSAEATEHGFLKTLAERIEAECAP